jgi:hypothetical protein
MVNYYVVPSKGPKDHSLDDFTGKPRVANDSGQRPDRTGRPHGRRLSSLVLAVASSLFVRFHTVERGLIYRQSASCHCFIHFAPTYSS